MNKIVTKRAKSRLKGCMKKNKETNQELEKVIAKIQGLEKPILSSGQNKILKQSILRKIEEGNMASVPFSLKNLVERIREIVRESALSIKEKVTIKERVFEAIEETSQKGFFFQRFFLFNKKFVSAFMAVMLVFGMVSYLNIDVTVVRAESFTVLDDISGEVLVEREGNVYQAKRGLKLQENDRILTAADSSVTVRYFDDSISRLSENTSLIVNRINRLNSIDSYVDVTLTEGQLWARVYNLVQDESAFVVKANNVEAVTKRAAFNVEVSNNTVEVGVFNQAVDIKSKRENERVVSGYKAIFRQIDRDSEAVVVRSIAPREKEQKWVAKNLASDEAYSVDMEKRLIAAKKQSMGLSPGEDVSVGTSFREDAVLLLTFNDVEREKLKVDLAEKTFVEALVKLNDSKLSSEEKKEVEKNFKEFSKTVEGFYEFSKEVGSQDEKYEEELDDYIQQKLLAHRKDLSVITPDSPSYKAKEVVDKLLVKGASNSKELVAIKRDQSLDKLAEAEYFVDKGDEEAAKQAADEYKEEVDETIEIARSTPQSLSQKEEIVKEVTKELDLLSVKNIVPDTEVLEMKTEIISGEEVEEEEDKTLTPIQIKPIPEVTEGDYGVIISGDKPLPPL